MRVIQTPQGHASPSSHPRAQLATTAGVSYPYAHGHIQDKIHSDDNNVSHTQLRSGSMEATGGVVGSHPAAGASAEPK
jgi:hypothetical protein